MYSDMKPRDRGVAHNRERGKSPPRVRLFIPSLRFRIPPKMFRGPLESARAKTTSTRVAGICTAGQLEAALDSKYMCGTWAGRRENARTNSCQRAHTHVCIYTHGSLQGGTLVTWNVSISRRKTTAGETIAGTSGRTIARTIVRTIARTISRKSAVLAVWVEDLTWVLARPVLSPTRARVSAIWKTRARVSAIWKARGKAVGGCAWMTSRTGRGMVEVAAVAVVCGGG